MRVVCLIATFALCLGSIQPVLASEDEAKNSAAAASAVAFEKQAVPLLKKYCVSCHGEFLQEADVRFDERLDPAKLADDEKKWRTTIDMLRSGAMPPEDVEQPTEAERRTIVQAIERAVYNLDCENRVDPGRVTIRRLNRAEYNNTVRDLLGVTFARLTISPPTTWAAASTTSATC